MSLKSRLRRPIVALVALVVVVMSLLYLSDFTRVSFSGASDRADLVAEQFKLYLENHLNLEMDRHGLHPTSVAEWENGWTAIIRNDPDITEMLNRTLAKADLALAILVTDEHGDVLAASPAATDSSVLASAEDLHDIERRWWAVNLWDLMTRRENYLVTRTIGFEGRKQALFNITIVIRSVLLRHEVEPALKSLVLAFALALCVAIVLGAVLPNLIIDPLQRVSQSIDLIRTGQFGASTGQDHREPREFADVHSKLSLLDEQYRGAKQDASELRTNIEQLLQSLEESVLLFDPTGRLIMAGEPAERMLGQTHDSMAGRTLDELFPPSTVLGGIIGNAVRNRESIGEQRVTIPRAVGAPQRLAVGVQILRKSANQETMGALVTLRDVESRRQLERQLDFSTRLAAISRLTGGVAHEIKNPLNAMALHLEVLKNKLNGEEPEIEVIGREIKRLDSVVKTFLNFNRPVDLQYKPIDFNDLVKEVLSLVSVDANAKQVRVESAFEDALWINADPDLLKQAILNVINNGLEAMSDGGSLITRTERDGDECLLIVGDAGPGIPLEIQNRVFQLYFTTKENGSGIGLATTFRVVQLHNGTIDFTSEPGKGTTFRLRFPRMVDHESGALSSATTAS
ncbi:MAG TPA: ATP-binding protein [Bryobacteraceae bacterium]|jgi:PAS domain S-box-containing protein|nr:ATP-binding protein [Bryobacteraceae bacterium]